MTMIKRCWAVVCFGLLCLQAYCENWMARLPDRAYVSTLTIPGAHDAATGSGWASGYAELADQYARTQDLTIAEQWTLGIRAFDLRPCSYSDHLNLNHGMMPTVLHFDEVLCQLRDSLLANPSEFVVIHLLHATDGDQVKDVYESQLLDVLRRNDLKGFLVGFKSYLRVSDMRGKILILSRNTYATSPVGGFFQNWTGSAEWSQQTQGRIVGPNGATGTLYMQDYAETWAEGAQQTKIDALCRLLDFSTTHRTLVPSQIVWVFNFMSAFSMRMSLLGYNISLSDGYRDNATHTHAALLQYLESHAPGPVGVVLMDYVGVDESAGYAVRGRETVRTLIEHNFRYMEEKTDGISMPRSAASDALWSVDGVRRQSPQHGRVNIVRSMDGTVRKVRF